MGGGGRGREGGSWGGGGERWGRGVSHCLRALVNRLWIVLVVL